MITFSEVGMRNFPPLSHTRLQTAIERQNCMRRVIRMRLRRRIAPSILEGDGWKHISEWHKFTIGK
jgi:hypothetical protein